MYRSYAAGVENAYSTIKQYRNLDETLIACHFKEKQKSNAIKRCDAFRKEEEERLQMQRRQQEKMAARRVNRQKLSLGRLDSEGNENTLFKFKNRKSKIPRRDQSMSPNINPINISCPAENESFE